MSRVVRPLFCVVILAMAVIGCGRDSKQESPKDSDAATAFKEPKARIEAARSKLAPDDQKAVALQEFCPVSDKRLGTMGKPFKLSAKGQEIFLCCDGCRDKALGDVEKTLETVGELKEVQEARSKLGADDRRLVEAQEFCPVMEGNRLGVMGIPFKLMVRDQPVFLCCKGCNRKALAEPDQTLAKVEKLKAKAKELSTPP